VNVYGRVREGRLAEAIEKVGAAIFREKRVPSVYRMAVGAEQKNATLVESESCVPSFLVAAEGLEPQQGPTDQSDTSRTEARHNPTNSGQSIELRKSQQGASGHNSDTSGQSSDTRLHKKCAISVLRKDEVPADLAKVVSAWAELSEGAKRQILEIAASTRG
jgi:hypothetical protein